MPYYIQLNKDDVAVAATETSEPLAPAPHLVPVDGLRGDLLGQVYDRQASAAAGAPVFVAPATVDAPTRITRLAFRKRFTLAEKATLELASLDSPAAPMAQRQQAALLRAMLADQGQATYIDLDDQDTVAGVQALETFGLLATGRAAAILSAPVQPGEQP